MGGRARELGGDFSSFILFILFGGWAAATGPGRLRLASCGVLNREHQSFSPGCFAARASTCQEIIQRCPSLAGAGTWGLLAPRLPQASAAPADGLAPFLPQFPLGEKQTWNCRILNLGLGMQRPAGARSDGLRCVGRWITTPLLTSNAVEGPSQISSLKKTHLVFFSFYIQRT